MAEINKGKKENLFQDDGDGINPDMKPAADSGGSKFKFKISLSPKKVAMFLGLLVLLLIPIGGAYYTGLFDKIFNKLPSCENAKEGDKNFAECTLQREAREAATPGVFLDVPNVIVNLSGSGKSARFLKISIKIELDNAEELKKFEPLLPRVVDQFQMYLRELRLEDLQGTSGVYRMKIELLSRVRAAAPSTKVRDVLFQEILVQ